MDDIGDSRAHQSTASQTVRGRNIHWSVEITLSTKSHSKHGEALTRVRTRQHGGGRMILYRSTAAAARGGKTSGKTIYLGEDHLVMRAARRRPHRTTPAAPNVS